MIEQHAPAPLKPGAIIAIIAPAGQIHDHDDFYAGIKLLKEMGFEPRFPRELWPGTGYLADTDANRADELNRMWADSEVSALLAARGGYGCLRMAGQIDLEQLRNRPKMLIGFSDITVLHNSFCQQTSLISLHGPTLCSLAQSSKESLERFYQCLTGNWRAPLQMKGVEVLRGDEEARGRLIGGNLSTLLTLLGTPFEPEFKGRILFLEDVGEPPYRIDRMLTQLWLAGRLQKISGIILGDFSYGQTMETNDRIRHHESIWNRVLQLTSDTQIPVWGGFPIGHGPENMTLPHGAETVMDSRNSMLYCI
ncbi:MAG: LD-carboxypeptidase [Desulfoarculaceae bacterium]|nr:LD-carboxypeptidase [Desulfoarculaceae bacterium]